jgi:hypothetical protein
MGLELITEGVGFRHWVARYHLLITLKEEPKRKKKHAKATIALASIALESKSAKPRLPANQNQLLVSSEQSKLLVYLSVI